ncbi:MAG TPA: hypothetical protein ENN07_00810, partial [candidate division Zixibacteria bacterium]|nr:hypothetical protein [candidate division Zixibacteria bacterium]
MLNRIMLIAMAVAVVCFAGTPSFNEVIQVAQTHAEIEGGGAVAVVVPLDSDDGTIAFIALFEPVGWAIIPSAKDLRPIIAYSFESDFEIVQSPENVPLTIIKHDIESRIRAIPHIAESTIRRNRELWRSYLDRTPSLIDERTSSAQWGPYLDTKWNQGDPYNIFCPIDPETGARTPIGCVVTAMGQIVNYWEWPQSITFDTTDSYMSTATDPPIFIDAPTANMDTIDYNSNGFNPDDTTRAMFLWACGVAVKMQYKDGGSAAMSRDVATALVNKFGYVSADGIMPSSPSFYTDILWDVMNRKTTYLSIHSPEVGHAVVIDGYRETGEFHANFGWGGTADAWYFLPDELPHELTTVNYAIVNITPPVITHRPVEGLTAEAITGGHVYVRWDVPFDNTEPVIRYNVYRKHLDAAEFEFVTSSTARNFTDRYAPELKDYVYAVSAVYANDVPSKHEAANVFTEIHDGWNRMIVVAGDEEPHDIAPNGAGGFVAVGQRTIAGTTNLYLVNISVSGDTIWTRMFGGEGWDRGSAIARTPDGGYAVIGETESFGDGGRDIWLIRLDSDGDTLWTRTFGSAGNDSAKDIIATDCGLVLLGTVAPSGDNLMALMCADAGGNLIWEKTYEGLIGNSIAERGGFLFIGGYHVSGPHGNSDALLMKADATGDSIWTRAFGGANVDMINSIALAPDGGIMLAGISRSYGMPLFPSAYYIKT